MSDSPELELPKRTTPTWDMELLISGATVLGLLQMTSVIEEWSVWSVTQNELSVQQAIMTLLIYVQFSVLVLAVTFVLHLFLRGYWVALVGLNSVYPDGIRWEKFRERSPIGTQQAERHAIAVPDLIERADNRATWVFGMGFALALMMVGPAVVVGGLAVLLLLGQILDWPLQTISSIYWWGLAIIGLPLILITMLDATIGKRLVGTLYADWLGAMYRAYLRLGIGRNQNPLLAIVVSHMPSRWAMAGITAVVVAVMFFVASSLVARARVFDNGAFDGLPKRSVFAEQLLFDGHYADRRSTDGIMSSPFIPSPLITGKTLTVFVPYRPRGINEALREACPEALETPARSAGDGLDCLARILEPQLDGKPLPLELLAATDPASEQRGAMAFVDIRDLPKGMHLLTLRRLPIDPEQPEAERWHKIEFWRQ